MTTKKSLGKGLGALISDNFNLESNENTHQASIDIAIDKIIRNESQPRRTFDEAAMSELVNSIRTHGVITPIIVVPRGENYMIIAGERRWRASKRAGLLSMPAIVRDYDDKQIKEISLIENLQREDINPIETAIAIRQLMNDYNYTQEQVADRVGKSRSAIANLLGLLSLELNVMDMVADGILSVGHAKVLTSIDKPRVQFELASKAISGGLSVRAFENLVRNYKENGSTEKPPLSPELTQLCDQMQRLFATRVTASGNDAKGRINIDYFTRDDIDRISELIEKFTEYINS